MVVTMSESPVVVVLRFVKRIDCSHNEKRNELVHQYITRRPSSGSMEPAFQRGDILFLNNRGGGDAISVGDIVVFKIAGRDVPIVHRVHRRHDAANVSLHTTSLAGPAASSSQVSYLTKGDANAMDDRDLYAPGQLWLARHEIVGRAVAYVPYLGMFTILLNDYPVRRLTVLICIAPRTIVLLRQPLSPHRDTRLHATYIRAGA